MTFAGVLPAWLSSAWAVRREPVIPPLWDTAQEGIAFVRQPGARSIDTSPLTVAWVNLAGSTDADPTALSVAERARAQEIDDADRRARFVAGRAFVRRALGRHIDGEPYRGDFVVGRFGKPSLPSPHASLNFNVSHAGDLIVVAIRRGGAIGVDVEKRDRPIPHTLIDIAFNDDERRRLLQCDDWRTACLLGWTCKEAVLKCLSCGLLRDPKRINVMIDNGCVHHSLAHELSEQGTLVGTCRIVRLPWSREMLGVIAVPCV